jgi:L-iditol 2-dehydrogenase
VTGHPSGLETAIESCRISGNIVLVGNPAVEEMRLIAKCYGLILRKELSIVGIWNSLINEYPKNDWQVVLQQLKQEEDTYKKTYYTSSFNRRIKEFIDRYVSQKGFSSKGYVYK